MFLLNVNFENLTLGLHVLYILQFNIANKLNNHQLQIMNRLCKMGFCYSVCANRQVDRYSFLCKTIFLFFSCFPRVKEEWMMTVVCE